MGAPAGGKQAVVAPTNSNVKRILTGDVRAERLRTMTKASVSVPYSAFKHLLNAALREDAAARDATSRLLPKNHISTAAIIAKQKCVLAGMPVLKFLGKEIKVKILAQDGDILSKSTTVARLTGSSRRILQAERTILNLMGRLSGIATLTREYTRRLAEGSPVRILDTRKTTPGLRALEKYAVACGGGTNHRFDLEECVFIKDNHIAAVGLRHFRTRLDPRTSRTRPVIIEVDRLGQLREALELDPDRVLLDNFSDKAIRETAIKLRHDHPHLEIEVSGGITPERIRRLSKMPIDFISVGATTHSATSADFSLEIK